MISVYTDGAASPDGWGGWAWTDGTCSEVGGEAATTNQRMELFAAIRAIQAHPEPVCVHSDSAYVVNCFAQHWHANWARNGWRSSAGKPVANRDLWECLIALVAERGATFVKVKGHSGHPLNDLADQLAVTAKEAARARHVLLAP